MFELLCVKSEAVLPSEVELGGVTVELSELGVVSL